MADKYALGATLGQGQWGVVRRATRKSDGIHVAIKKVRCAGGAKLCGKFEGSFLAGRGMRFDGASSTRVEGRESASAQLSG